MEIKKDTITKFTPRTINRANPETVERLRKQGINVEVRDKNNDIDLRGQCFENKDLSGLSFANINVQGGQFKNCNLSNVNFSENDLTFCLFINVITNDQTAFPRNFDDLKKSNLVTFMEKQQ